MISIQWDWTIASIIKAASEAAVKVSLNENFLMLPSSLQTSSSNSSPPHKKGSDQINYNISVKYK